MSWIVADETSTPFPERAPVPERVVPGAAGRRHVGVARRMSRRKTPGTRCPVCDKGFSAGARFCPFDGEGLVSDAAPRSADPLLGGDLGGRYRVEALVGEGGMGCVYQVTHMALSRPMAAKVLRAELVAVGDLSRRFLEEARAAAAIDHPHVIRISDYGVLPSGRPYFVMELLAGESLRSLLDGGPMDPRRVAHIARQVARGLAAAHHVGVVHRDLKPDNVHVDPDAGDFVKVLDFGLARLPDAAKLTRRGVVFGTPQYMSPEQATGEPLDGRTDIYALGVMMYEMLAGQVPFDAPTFAGVLQLHLHEPLRAVQRLLPPGRELGGLDLVVSRCLAKRPEHRFASMEEVIDALEDCNALLTGACVGTRDTEPSLGRERAPARKGWGSWQRAALRWGVMSLALGGFFVAIWFGGGRAGSSAAPAPHVDPLRAVVHADAAGARTPSEPETVTHPPPARPADTRPGPTDAQGVPSAVAGSGSHRALAEGSGTGGSSRAARAAGRGPRSAATGAASHLAPGDLPHPKSSDSRRVAAPISYPGEIIDPWAEPGEPRP